MNISFNNLGKTILLMTIALTVSSCRLSMDVVGDGAGCVVSEPYGIDCGIEGAECEGVFEYNTVVTLTAVPGPDSYFDGWRGACTGDDPTCTIVMDRNHHITARFRTEITNPDQHCGTEEALSRCLEPQYPPEYYIEQGELYFYTMDKSIPIEFPNYSDMVVRWEWPPWLWLTGLGRASMYWTTFVLRQYPTTYAMIECEAFDVQPFCRCHVVFDYSGELCPIYEEFTFNDQGEITFIEAWTDLPGWLPMEDPEDYWGEGENVSRLSTRMPGLGNETGRNRLYEDWMDDAAETDVDLTNYLRRARQPYETWLEELLTHFGEVAGGCNPAE